MNAEGKTGQAVSRMVRLKADTTYAFALCVAMATAAAAQTPPRPAITGVVQDQTGAVLAGGASSW